MLHSSRNLLLASVMCHHAVSSHHPTGRAPFRPLWPKADGSHWHHSNRGFHLASIIAGGPAPLIATALLAWTGSGYSVALYVLLSCLISIAATIPLPDYTNRDISEAPVYGLAESAVPAKASAGG